MLWKLCGHLGTIQKHLLGSLMQKKSLKHFDPPKGGLEKNDHNFPRKIEFIWFFMGLTHTFYVKKGGADIF